jgi:hypothetical protein
MKTLGRAEVAMALSRIRRLRALGRVSGIDAGYIEERLLQIDARIISMNEINEDGEEE